MKRLFKILVVIGIFLVCIVAFKDLIIKSAVTIAASRMMGAPVQMNSFSLDIFNSTIHITGFKIFNPAGFPEDVMVSCPKIDVIFDRASLLKQKYHLLLVDIDMEAMVLTKNKKGKLNVDLLSIAQKSKSSSSTPVQIDLLNLRIGKIVHKEYKAGRETSVRVDVINKQKSYKRIPTMEQLTLLVLEEPMKAALIKNAGIYGAAVLAGVSIIPVIPVAVAATFIGKYDVQQSVDVPLERVYKISLEVIKQMGRITKDDKPHNEIKADINGSMVTLSLKKNADSKTKMTISARKYIFPEADVAGGVLYQILDKL